MGDSVTIDSGIFRRIGLEFEFLRHQIVGESMEIKKAIGEVILKKAKELVPVQTGALKRSGRLSMTKDRRTYEVRFGNSRVRYAQVVEFGRVAYAPFPPRLYLTRAVRYSRKASKSGVERQLNRIMEKHIPRRFR